ncbi:MAG TPA: GntR family transcriptional regulator [Actinomycetaceae bacterium]|nr:GntR family transcriptional regulator [Actinomycetaceae bacterium]
MTTRRGTEGALDESAPRPDVDAQTWAQCQIRDAIIDGELAPGSRLVEAELVQTFGVSRNRVRLALDTLIEEGLVERIPNRGARVRVVSAEEAIEIMECRMVLDGLLGRKAATHASDEHLEALAANLVDMAAQLEAYDLMGYSRLIQKQHAIVHEAAAHATAGRLIERLQAQIVRHQFQTSLIPGRASESLRELQDVVAAITARDPDAAERAARDHVKGAIEAIRRSSQLP